MLKVILPLIVLSLAIFSCKKEVSNLEESSFLEVEEKNMGVVAKRTATWCGPCGDWGFDYFDALKQQYGDDAVFMAFKHSFGAEGDYFFDKVNDVFGVGNGTPRFFYNFDTIHGVNYAGAGSVGQHNDSEVIANANYAFKMTGEKITVSTTTKFFKAQQGDFVISPFLIIDNQVGYQAGNADSPNTVHPSFVANLAHPVGNEVAETWGYKVASGDVQKGYQINLEFEVNREAQWTEDDISFALILYKRVGNQYKFVNAFTK